MKEIVEYYEQISNRFTDEGKLSAKMILILFGMIIKHLNNQR